MFVDELCVMAHVNPAVSCIFMCTLSLSLCLLAKSKVHVWPREKKTQIKAKGGKQAENLPFFIAFLCYQLIKMPRAQVQIKKLPHSYPGSAVLSDCYCFLFLKM